MKLGSTTILNYVRMVIISRTVRKNVTLYLPPAQNAEPESTLRAAQPPAQNAGRASTRLNWRRRTAACARTAPQERGRVGPPRRAQTAPQESISNFTQYTARTPASRGGTCKYLHWKNAKPRQRLWAEPLDIINLTPVQAPVTDRAALHTILRQRNFTTIEPKTLHFPLILIQHMLAAASSVRIRRCRRTATIA